MPRGEWTATALEDLLAVVDWIAAHNPVAAQALKNDVAEKVAHLAGQPRMGRPGRVEGTRELVVRPTYVVVYREHAETVRVLRVLHAARMWPEGG